MEIDSDQATPRLAATKVQSPNDHDRDHDPDYDLDPPELWRYSANGAGIERTFSFKSFQAAWVRTSNSVVTAPVVQLSAPQEHI